MKPNQLKLRASDAVLSHASRFEDPDASREGPLHVVQWIHEPFVWHPAELGCAGQ